MKKRNLASRLIFLFCCTSLIPILIFCIFTYYNSSRIIEKNTEELNRVSLKQMDDNLNILIGAYEDLLYQIYTNDDMVTWIDKLNKKEDEAVTVNQMRRFVQSILNSKDFIRSVTIITENGFEVTYDQITAQSFHNAWMEEYSINKEELYDQVIKDYNMHVFPTEYATTFANNDYYLFHVAHRVVDYKNLNKQSGIVIMSLDATLLAQLCETTENSNNFIVSEDGKIISYQDKSKIGDYIPIKDYENPIDDYSEFLENEYGYKNQYIMISAYPDEKLGWNIVSASDQSRNLMLLRQQVYFTLFLGMGLFIVTIIVMLKFSREILRSVNSIVKAMGKTYEGNLEEQVSITKEMSSEIETIAVAYNEMLNKLKSSTEKEKEAIALQQDAQIKALEAQINPHFLYNTLDTINWMAIDQDAFDISNAINSLAKILRYAISESDREVTIAEEIDWLKKYIYLQQLRLKEQLVFNIEVNSELYHDKIHKLLLQPFVENAILHGFKDKKEQHILNIKIWKEEKELHITIMDNGSGISKDTLVSYQDEKEIDTKVHIGMKNALLRLKMYYGESAKLEIESEEEIGTKIHIRIPVIEKQS